MRYYILPNFFLICIACSFADAMETLDGNGIVRIESPETEKVERTFDFTVTDIKILKQRSVESCKKGHSWNWSGGPTKTKIWVQDKCAAEFQLVGKDPTIDVPFRDPADQERFKPKLVTFDPEQPFNEKIVLDKKNKVHDFKNQPLEWTGPGSCSDDNGPIGIEITADGVTVKDLVLIGARIVVAQGVENVQLHNICMKGCGTSTYAIQWGAKGSSSLLEYSDIQANSLGKGDKLIRVQSNAQLKISNTQLVGNDVGICLTAEASATVSIENSQFYDCICDFQEPICPRTPLFAAVPQVNYCRQNLKDKFTFSDPNIDPKKGYHVQEVPEPGSGVHWITDGAYHMMTVDCGIGLCVVDAPAQMFAKIPAALREINGCGSSKVPIKCLIYSHHHSDHISAAKAVLNTASDPEAVDIIAHKETARFLESRQDSNRPVPTVTCEANCEVAVIEGGKADACDTCMQLLYFGVNHTPGNIGIYVPRAKVLMIVDLLYVGWPPFISLAVAENLAGYLTSTRRILNAVDFDVLIAGHLTRLGNRGDVGVHKEYTDSVLHFALQAWQTVNFVPPATLDESWNAFGSFYNNMTQLCADKVKKYWEGGPLRSVDVFVETHCRSILVSQNIDIGFLGCSDLIKNDPVI